MSDYYDRNKFTGGQRQSAPPPRTPPPPRPAPPPPRTPPPPTPRPGSGGSNNDWWHSWPVIVILFAIGLWPLALGLLIYNIVQEDKKRGGQRYTASTTETAAERAIREARARAAANEAARQASLREREAREAALRQAEAQANAQPGSYTPPPQTQPPPQPRPSQPQPSPQTQARPKDQPAAGSRTPKRPKTPLSSKLMRVFGGLLLFVGGIALSEALPDVLRYGSLYLEASIGFMATGGVLFWRGHYLARMTRRSQRYILAIGNADAMPLEEIAKRVNRTPEKAAKELQKLIDKGYLGEDAYIDHERGYFLRFGATLDEEEAGEEAPAQPAPAQTESGYAGILRNIRHANDRIADEALSRKIDRLEQISGIIFKEVEAHPEKRERIHTFFDYYLPTTQKLLDAYADFEETGVEGENLRQAKERIEQTMDAIVAGFEHQLDQLYSSDAMDVVSDIKVMEAMLNRDTASAAKDFGYDRPAGDDGGEEDGGAQDGGVTLQL